MRKFGFAFLTLIGLSLIWMGFIREALPPIPEIVREISPEVKFDFSIHTMDYSAVELSLNNKVKGQGMFVQFKMGNAWKTGRTGLVLQGIKGNSAFKDGMKPDQYLKDENRQRGKTKDFSDFMQDKGGRSISTYSFRQTLVEDRSGKTFMRMSYDGPAMEMLQMLEIPRPVTIPAPISQQFISKGIIQFEPGNVAFDSKIKGFNIPVTIR